MACGALQRVERSARRSAAARREFVRAIVAAKEAGETQQAIADAAGLSRQRVAQILKEADV